MMPGIATFDHGGRKYRYHVVNKATAWRVETLFAKEPDTIAWIDAMPEGAHFVDIGANVGMYTVYAGVRGLHVTAFEPESENYAILCRNIRENKIDAIAYCAALSDKFSVDKLYMSATTAGGSCHTFGESLDHNLQKRKNGIHQGAIAIELDSLGLAADYIKMDVDGLEHVVVSGGMATIKKAKSVLIEINMGLIQHIALIKSMRSLGFDYDEKQATDARRTEGAFTGCGNIIFNKS